MPELVGEPGDERHLRTDDDEVRLERARELEHPVDVLGPHGMAGRAATCDAGVARSGVQFAERRAVCELPRERMLAPAGPHEQHFHAAECFRRAGGAHVSGMVEPGLDMHEWETEWAQLEEAMEESPVEALPEVHELVTRMLRERGVPLDEVEEPPGEEDELVSAYRAAAEVTRLVEQGSDSVSLGDVAAAWQNFRLVHDSLIAERPAP